uniref:Uncharacterized protein n=1 Tax=Panagrolaimus sp. JU765 TaxID=591449 RepID=A0AC34R7A4_9BILA
MIVENDEKPKEPEQNKENNKKEVVENVSVKGAGDSTVLDESANEQEMEIEEEAGEKIELSTEENEQEMEIEEGADENMSEKAIIETSKLLNEVNIGEAEEEKTDFVAKDDFHGVCLSLSYLSA